MTEPATPPLHIADEVSDAIASGMGVVALESTIISHGLPSDSAAGTALEIEAAVREGGSVPATIALIDGQVRVGLDPALLDRLAEDPDVVKTSLRDLGPVLARGAASGLAGATTVAATTYLAGLAGIRVFATGGLGGVHRGAERTWDESADLLALAETPTTVVCAGVKSILDVPATLERLESLSVPVLGYRTDSLPGFYVRDAGLPVPWRVETVAEVATVMRARDGLNLTQGLVIAQPVAVDAEMDRSLHEETLAAGLQAAAAAAVTGKDATPFLLEWFHEHTGGASLRANVALVLANARLAGEIARTFAELQAESSASE